MYLKQNSKIFKHIRNTFLRFWVVGNGGYPGAALKLRQNFWIFECLKFFQVAPFLTTLVQRQFSLKRESGSRVGWSKKNYN